MKIYKYITILTIGLVAFGCDQFEDNPTAEEHFMAQPIPQVAVEDNYIVGASYRSFEWNANVTETPAAGTYDALMGDATAYSSHVQQAQNGGIDYFLFTVRSTAIAEQFAADAAFIDNLQSASNAANMNFAISYNFGALDLADSRRIENEGKVSTLLADFEAMLPYFQQGNYMKIDGRSVVRIENGHNLYANDNAAVYQQLRSHMSGLGVDLYIIANQQDWTPPARYDFRFINGVDAVSHNTYANISQSWYDRYIQFHKMAELAWSYSRDFFAENGLDYAPTISPSINPQITNSGSSNYAFEKNAQWFSDLCNVARVATGAQKLIMLDSFNDWNAGKQIEAATSYGEEYLSILRAEFKVN